MLKGFPCPATESPHITSRSVARAHEFQSCYILTRVCLLPSVAVPPCHLTTDAYTVLLRCSHKHKYSGFKTHDLAAQDTGPPQTIHHFRRFQFKNVLTTMLEFGAASSYLGHIHSLDCNGPSSSSGKLFCKKPYTVYAGEHEGSPATPYTPQHHIY
jgi:hypothetical protein